MGNFGAQLHAFADRTGEKIERVDLAFKLQIFNRVVRNTRVADPSTWKRPDPTYLGGTMRGNWQVSTGAPSRTFIEARRNQGAALPASEAGKILPFSVTWLSNNTPYAPFYEDIDGMVRLAVADALRQLAAAVAES